MYQKDINMIILTGRLTHIDKVRYSKEGNRPFIIAGLAVKNLQDTDTLTYVRLVFMEERIRMIKKHKVGERVLIEGKLSVRRRWHSRIDQWIAHFSIFVMTIMPIRLKPDKQELKELKKQLELDEIPF